jgi:PAS domain S-box-containing protein
MPHDFTDDPDGLNRILESIPEFVLMVDRDGIIRYINRLEPGYNRDEVIGMQAEVAMLPGSQRAFREALARVLSGAESTEYEGEVTLPDGNRAWYQSRMTAYRSGGSVVGVVVVATNITELHLAREAAETLRKLLPICSWCDRIQDEAGAWESIESYVGRRESARVSHGLREDCFRRQVEGLDDSNGADERLAAGDRYP